MLRHRLFCIAAAAVLDLVIGDPQWMPHPVRWIGRLITVLEDWLRGHRGQKNTAHRQEAQEVKKKGALLVLIVLIVTAVATVLLVRVMSAIHPVLGTAAEIILCCYTLAARNLRDSAMAVYQPLVRGSIERARKAVSMIVGRDTSVLDAEGIARAAVETVAENTADGVIAPMFYLFLGGTTGGMIYKAINTMDSMLGYHNEEYQYFGTVAARLDDVAGFFPARLSALCLIAAARITGMDAKGAYKIFLRDRHNHTSPNSAQTEAACAGALGVQLGGGNYYFGKYVEKPTIGDATRPVEAADIARANKLMYATAALGLGAAALVGLFSKAGRN